MMVSIKLCAINVLGKFVGRLHNSSWKYENSFISFWLHQPSQLLTYLASFSIYKVWNVAFIIALLVKVDQLEGILQLRLNI